MKVYVLKLNKSPLYSNTPDTIHKVYLSETVAYFEGMIYCQNNDEMQSAYAQYCEDCIWDDDPPCTFQDYCTSDEVGFMEVEEVDFDSRQVRTTPAP